MDRFFAGDPSARRHFDIVELASMPRPEAKEVLTKGFEKAGVTYDESALERHIDVAGGYPHSIQMIGHHLIEADSDQKITDEDWDRALRLSAIELTRKDFSEMYDFKGKGTLRETVLNILALVAVPTTKQNLRDLADGKNIYTSTCLGELKKSGAIKERPDGTIVLHSMLFRAAILIHLYTQASSINAYKELIDRFAPPDAGRKSLP